MPKKKTRTKTTPPDVNTFVLCDAISRDPNTGKATLYGLFSNIITSKLPSDPVTFGFYVSMGGGSGKQALTFQVVDPDGERISESKSDISIDCEPGTTIDLMGRTAIPFKKLGKHEVVLRIGRKTLAKRSIDVTEQQRRKPRRKSR